MNAVEKTLDLYKSLLDVYTTQVKGLEEQKKEANKKHRLDYIRHSVLNSRIFTYDEYLTNQFHGGWCYEEKNLIMPHLVPFIAQFEKLSQEEIAAFEANKPKNDYQDALDYLYKNKGSFSALLKNQLKELSQKESDLRIPRRPQRRNATRQMSDYMEETEEYEEKLASLRRCRKEVEDRIELFNSFAGE